MVNPVTTMGEALPVALMPSGLEVTVYPAIAAPPSLAEALKLTLAWPAPASAAPIAGASGAMAVTSKLWLTLGAAV